MPGAYLAVGNRRVRHSKALGTALEMHQVSEGGIIVTGKRHCLAGSVNRHHIGFGGVRAVAAVNFLPTACAALALLFAACSDEVLDTLVTLSANNDYFRLTGTFSDDVVAESDDITIDLALERLAMSRYFLPGKMLGAWQVVQMDGEAVDVDSLQVAFEFFPDSTFAYSRAIEYNSPEVEYSGGWTFAQQGDSLFVTTIVNQQSETMFVTFDAPGSVIPTGGYMHWNAGDSQYTLQKTDEASDGFPEESLSLTLSAMGGELYLAGSDYGSGSETIEFAMGHRKGDRFETTIYFHAISDAGSHGHISAMFDDLLITLPVHIVLAEEPD